MTNSFIKRGLLVVSATLFLLAGCKKDDTTSSFSVTGPTSIYFWDGQTKQTAYSARNIVAFSYDTPDGWTCVAKGGVFEITAPASGGDASGTVKITATTTASSTLTVTVDVAVKTSETIPGGNANSYMVNKASQRYKFNAGIKGNETAPSMTPGDALLVWCNPADAINHVSLESDGCIYFSTKDATALECGNALIAALNADNGIIWSWHIWAVDYNPATDYDVLDGKTVMSRNLGAIASSNATTDEVGQSYGMYYQWGRKDPFPGPNSWASTTQLYLYNAKSKAVTLAYTTTAADIGTVAYATANPATFIAGTEDTAYDWLYAARNNDLWGAVSNKKTLADPCPAGWKVAPALIWSDFATGGESSSNTANFNVDGAYSYGWTFLDDNDDPTYWPGAGRRSFSNLLASSGRNFTNVINPEFVEPGEPGAQPVGFYWSDTADTAGESKLLAFRDDYVNPGADTYTAVDDTGSEDGWSPEGARAGGFPLRCVRE